MQHPAIPAAVVNPTSSARGRRLLPMAPKINPLIKPGSHHAEIGPCHTSTPEATASAASPAATTSAARPFQSRRFGPRPGTFPEALNPLSASASGKQRPIFSGSVWGSCLRMVRRIRPARKHRRSRTGGSDMSTHGLVETYRKPTRLIASKAVIAALAILSLAVPAVGETASLGSTTCKANIVHYTRFPDRPNLRLHGIPWISPQSGTRGVAGFLFYFGSQDYRGKHPTTALISIGGRTSDGNTKILWWIPGGATALTVTGRSNDGATIRQTFPRALGPPQFPSILNLPSPGCWRVSVRSGQSHATFTFVAA